MALKKAHKEMLKGAGVTFGIAVFMKEKFDHLVASVSRMVGRG
tara:strand:+ start:29 stop:157 length:129 start_codon:yes stop_codon:yes gene_type:complete